jgi:hypothetical protein
MEDGALILEERPAQEVVARMLNINTRYEERIQALEHALKLTEEDIIAAMTGPITRGKFAVLRGALHRNRTVLATDWREERR